MLYSNYSNLAQADGYSGEDLESLNIMEMMNCKVLIFVQSELE